MGLVAEGSTELMCTFQADIISNIPWEYSRQGSDQLEALTLLSSDCKMKFSFQVAKWIKAGHWLPWASFHICSCTLSASQIAPRKYLGPPHQCQESRRPSSQNRAQHSQLQSRDGRPILASPRPLGNGLTPAPSDYNAPNDAVSQNLYLTWTLGCSQTLNLSVGYLIISKGSWGKVNVYYV